MRRTRRVAALISSTGAALALAVGVMSPASAETPPQPGSFRGLGFDQCMTQTQSVMDRWLTHSPFQAVGVYTSGRERYCRDQPNLTPTWVREQARKGWRILPITLDLQTACTNGFPRWLDSTISTDSSNKFYRARKQGVGAAQMAVDAAGRLGIPAGSTLWLDLEGFDDSNWSCRTSALAFQHGWNGRLRGMGYVPGLYSSAGSGIQMVDEERMRPSSYRWSLPSQIWLARYDGQMNLQAPGYLSTTSGWLPGGRLKQFNNSHDETWGGKTVQIDRNWLQLGGAYRAQPGNTACGGVGIAFPTYATFKEGVSNNTAQVKALQCLLRVQGLYSGSLHGRYDKATATAGVLFQRRAERPQSRQWRPQDWTALLSRGHGAPTLKQHGFDPAVGNLQRALNAALGAKLSVTGKYDGATTAAVRTYQARRGVARTGNVTSGVWWHLFRGGI